MVFVQYIQCDTKPYAILLPPWTSFVRRFTDNLTDTFVYAFCVNGCVVCYWNAGLVVLGVLLYCLFDCFILYFCHVVYILLLVVMW